MLLVNGQTLFCRALTGPSTPVTGSTAAPPTAPVACVQFNTATGAVANPSYLLGLLGTALVLSRRSLTPLIPTQADLTGIADAGVPDSAVSVTLGFRRGWYQGVYWRVCGEFPNEFVAGGVPGDEYLYNTYGTDQGENGTLMIASVPGVGTTFCRGVGVGVNPYFACVLFEGTRVAAEYGLYQQLGQKSDYASFL
ncbi:hypothetical protein BC830DRAFT_756438 [Chytriomyces sp. MP71]|nr:hypothetical protein BC830DRAFT_756438 [Chytriomyces sp. MP71]